MRKKVLIVGGVAGGASTAARLRRLDENVEIILFERDRYISFANCGLPYYIGGSIKERDHLLVQTPEGMKDRFNIDVRINSEVICIDPRQKAVKVRSKEGGEYREQYDYLVLSPGARAIKPNIEGIDSPRIFTLRNIPDTDKIKTYVSEREIKCAVVIGGGFVGVEMAENLKQRGLEVTIVEAAPHILAPFDTEIVAAVEKELSDNGVKLVLNDGVKEFKNQDSSVEITLTSGAKLEANLVILAMGVIPDTDFLEDSGIQLGAKGHILVNEKMETNVTNVFAVGDAIEVVDFVNKQNSMVPLAGPANKQGRIAADNIAGLGTTYRGTQGTSIIKVFKLTAACTGNNERTLNKLNMPNRTITIHPFSHATYYPGAKMLTLKLIFNDSGKILGAQGVGNEGVDKRIDVIATVIRLGGTIKDLTELELCYAPPFSSARDPVNLAGYVAENVLSGRVETLTAEQLPSSKKENTILLDVRTVKEVSKKGYIEGAINIPIDSLRKRIGELDRSKEILVYCQIGLRGYVAARFLTQHGFKVKNLDGGYVSVLRSKYN
ncbi:NAD(FAD)-dependent dehydrogenase [Desulfosporosinus orientis DSM 765]|uniref:NAD(FAD)-dependent dehydrogenase n=1 Tax=Desulfosporosinus orientis (strain ATCC 19365 / DSM 765 / NCIMB 8382 / VKM B-1628 / Singapore I) TaxID=768706 RepID=G7WGX9_DESOD|nr:CoA-disulfide reductase [Desulfosporosinus orientis]AET68993.1 NAD(FAD)-dependent dehydrogenase [Desulfosporosinus orientis DSM 765]